MRGEHPIASEMATPDMIRRPLRDLIAGLAQLPTTPSGEPDYSETDPAVLVDLAESAELVLQIVQEGLASIGLLYAHTANQIAEGNVNAAHAVAIGRLQVELGELLPCIYRLSSECRRYTADYVGD
ncbi:hypothetical protein [Burkholderia pseudomallei]|uniref:hypothetical protein n=1 Tax=Burkholderia pseudomallei TaxID=28450 RepID=UPI001AD7D6D5|nr:hypothetical protein [Burkholderia pseudomallei]MBO7837753.1 hypothetical protein [Burkholderia pseudomallei]